MRGRYLAVAAAVAVGATVAGGAAIAASKPTHLQACANAKGVLQLLLPNGKCASGFTKVAISERGPRGATGRVGLRGAPGPAGARGKPGAPGLGPQASIASASVSRGKLVGLDGTGVTVRTSCTPTTTAKLVFTGPGNYLVHGVSDTATTGSIDATTASQPSSGSTTDVIDTGSALIDFQTDTASATTKSTVQLAGSDGTGDLSTNLLVSIGSRTWTIDVALTVGPNTCGAAAQVMATA